MCMEPRSVDSPCRLACKHGDCSNNEDTRNSKIVQSCPRQNWRYPEPDSFAAKHYEILYFHDTLRHSHTSDISKPHNHTQPQTLGDMNWKK